MKYYDKLSLRNTWISDGTLTSGTIILAAGIHIPLGYSKLMEAILN